MIFFQARLKDFKDFSAIQVEFAKEEVEIRAESLKIQIDEIKNRLFDRFDKIKLDYEE